MSDPKLSREVSLDSGPVEIPPAPRVWWPHAVVAVLAGVIVVMVAGYIGVGAP